MAASGGSLVNRNRQAGGTAASCSAHILRIRNIVAAMIIAATTLAYSGSRLRGQSLKSRR